MQDKGKKTCVVLLDNKKETRNLLCLAHYSLRLSSVFVFESGYAFVLANHYQRSKTPIKSPELKKRGLEWLNIFKNEHVFNDEYAVHEFSHRLKFLADIQALNYNHEKDEITLTEKKSPLINLCVQMAEVFVDTYLIVCQAVDFICGRHLMLKHKELVAELHNLIAELH